MTWLHRAQLTAVTGAAVLVLSAGIAATALGTGQPGVAGNECRETAGAELTPGQSISAKGSPFNPEGRAGEVYAGNPETASLEHTARQEIAVWQYDIACVQVTGH
jgi:hypothetical protein